MVDEITLHTRINEDVKNAMRNKETQRLNTLRLLTAAIKQRTIDNRTKTDIVANRDQTLTNQEILEILDKMIKQRRESIVQYQAGNRQDLVDQETAEITVLEEYLPPPLTPNEIESLIAGAIKETGASSIKDMGKVMGIIKPKVQGRADIGEVSAKIKLLLA